MLRSELAAMAPVAVQRPGAAEATPSADNESTAGQVEIINSTATSKATEATDVPAMPEPKNSLAAAAASIETATQVLATALTEGEPQAAPVDRVADQDVTVTAKEPVRPRRTR